MNQQLLEETDFSRPSPGWFWPYAPDSMSKSKPGGTIITGNTGEPSEVLGLGVHTRNGDNIELRFRVLGKHAGYLSFGFDADRHEHARVLINLDSGDISFETSDWTVSQPIATTNRSIQHDESHSLIVEKVEGDGGLIKNADVSLYLDGEKLMTLTDQNLLPEMGVAIQVRDASIVLERFIHRGVPTGIPEYLHIGGWQMLNADSIEENMQSLFRGIALSSQEGVELLVTPEASLTGLFPTSPNMLDQGAVQDAEKILRRFISEVPDAPYVVVGLPVWVTDSSSESENTKYIASRVYAPNGEVIHTGAKIHSAEEGFWHGYSLNEFKVKNVPVSMHICHDHRYPELQTLPVMFGCRLIVHPSNSSRYDGDVSSVQALAESSTDKTHAFYLNVDAAGSSYIAGPQTKGNLIAISKESRSEGAAHSMVGEPSEELVHSKIRIHDAFGYWPTRSFRASEHFAEGYRNLYRAFGGSG